MPIRAAIVVGSSLLYGICAMRFVLARFAAVDEDVEFLLPGGRPRGRGLDTGVGLMAGAEDSVVLALDGVG